MLPHKVPMSPVPFSISLSMKNGPGKPSNLMPKATSSKQGKIWPNNELQGQKDGNMSCPMFLGKLKMNRPQTHITILYAKQELFTVW